MARLCFFGTPDFALRTLDGLHAAATRSGHEITAVVCQPDKRKGRGKKMLPPPTKVRALELGLSVEQPATLKKGTPSGDAFYDWFAAQAFDLAVVAAYGRILPTRVLRLPRRGFLNVHGSLLPRWRGAAPIQRALMAGDTVTGVGLMDMVYALDAGDIYAEQSVTITDDDDALTLGGKLTDAGNALISEHLEAILNGTLKSVAQDTLHPDEEITYAHMLQKHDAWLHFDRPATAVRDQVRGCVPWPGAQLELAGDVYKVFAPDVRPAAHGAAPGVVLAADDALVVACQNGAIAFAEIQAPGKKRMRVRDFTRGRSLDVGATCTAPPRVEPDAT